MNNKMVVGAILALFLIVIVAIFAFQKKDRRQRSARKKQAAKVATYIKNPEKAKAMTAKDIYADMTEWDEEDEEDED